MKKPIIVHEAMLYRCEKCGSEWWMFVEVGLEQPGPDHKPTPFTVMCPVCKRGLAMDISGPVDIPGGLMELIPGESYFANVKKCDCGMPIYGTKLLKKERSNV